MYNKVLANDVHIAGDLFSMMAVTGFLRKRQYSGFRGWNHDVGRK